MTRLVVSTCALPAAVMVAWLMISSHGESAQPGTTGVSTPSPFRGVVILRDGGTLFGAITRDGERYRIATSDSEIIVGDANVEFVCGSLKEAYERKRAALDRPTVEARLDLAEWCLQHELMTEALVEVAGARKLDARHPRLVLLERRIAVAEEQRLAVRTDASNSTAAAPVAPEAVDSNAPAHTDVAPNDRERFDLLVSELPAGALERFTRKVQPVLVNSCASAGCHQAGSASRFQLDRSLLHDMANRRSTMQNLSATLALVDRDQPAESPLLTVPRRAHGGMETAVFGPRDDRLLRQLAEWVVLVTHYSDQAAATADSEPDLGEQLAGAAALEPANFEDPPTLRPRAPLQFGAILRPVEPRDEFDPEIFNRRFVPK